MSKKITQDDLDALGQLFNDKIIRLTGRCGLLDTIIETIRLDVREIQPKHSEMAIKDEIILTLSKEVERLSVERITLQTRIVKMRKEMDELIEKIEKVKK